MKRRGLIVCLGVLLILVPLAAPYPVAGSNNLDDVIPDENLRLALRERLNQPYGELYISDLQSITSVDLSDRGIVDITGLEFCVNLSRVDLANNSITSVETLARMHSPLAGTKLRDVSLANNQVTDITPLRELTQIQVLNLSGNRIRDLAMFRREAGSHGVRVLNLSDNEISDVSHLSSLREISILLLAGNQITDISPLTEIRGLAIGDSLDLYGNPLDEISIREIIPALKAKWVRVYWGDLTLETPPVEIDLPDPEIVTLPILIESVVRRTLGRPEGDILATEVARFTALDANGIDLHSLSGLGSFVNLRRFYLADNRLEDISPLLILDNLESVNLMRNPLNQASINDVIPRLKARGVEVIFEAPPVEKPAEPVPVKPEPPPSPVTPPPAPVPPPTPVVPPPAPVPPPAEPAGGSGAGAAVGGALGGLLVIGGVVFWWLRRRPRGGGEDGPGYTYRGR